MYVCVCIYICIYIYTVRHGGIGTGISDASKSVPSISVHKTVIVGFDFPAARSPSHFPWVEGDHLQARFTPCPNHIAPL